MKKKVCPRCFKKIPQEFVVCGNCGLNFHKLETATNSEAKKAIRQKEFDRVVFTSKLPYDINKWKLLVLTIFLGWLGVHMFKVGKFINGIVYAIINVIGTTLLILSQTDTKFFETGFWRDFFLVASLAFAVSLLFVFGDILKILLNQFKVPVSLPYSKE